MVTTSSGLIFPALSFLSWVELLLSSGLLRLSFSFSRGSGDAFAQKPEG